MRELREAAPDVAFVAMHGRDGEDGTVQELLEIAGIPYTGSGVPACARATDKVLAKHLMLEHGIPTPEFFAFSETAFRELGAAEALPAMEERLDFPIVVKPARGGSALGIRFARTAERRAGRARLRVLVRQAVLLERHVKGRDLAVSVLDGEALPVVEAIPREDELLRLRVALRDRPHRLRLPRRPARRRRRAGAASSPWRSTGCSAAKASPGST